MQTPGGVSTAVVVVSRFVDVIVTGDGATIRVVRNEIRRTDGRRAFRPIVLGRIVKETKEV